MLDTYMLATTLFILRGIYLFALEKLPKEIAEIGISWMRNFSLLGISELTTEPVASFIRTMHISHNMWIYYIHIYVWSSAVN